MTRIALCACLLALLMGCSGTFDPGDPHPQPEDVDPAWSPSGRYVAYFHLEPGSGFNAPSGLYVLDLQTGVPQFLLAGWPSTASWSPDESHLLIDEGHGLQTTGLDGDSLQTIYPEGGRPRWSPDGRTIAFLLHGDIWTLGVGDTIPQKVSPDGTRGTEDFSWCPNSRDLVATVYPPESDFAELYRISINGASTTRLTSDSVLDQSPAVSPQGAIAWNRSTPADHGAVRYEIWLMDSTGAGKRLLIPGYSRMMSWNRAGDAIVFSRDTSKGPRLFTIKTDRTGLRQITP